MKEKQYQIKEILSENNQPVNKYTNLKPNSPSEQQQPTNKKKCHIDSPLYCKEQTISLKILIYRPIDPAASINTLCNLIIYINNQKNKIKKKEQKN